eukprot:1819691-Rhodomonas_salina.3
MFSSGLALASRVLLCRVRYWRPRVRCPVTGTRILFALAVRCPVLMHPMVPDESWDGGRCRGITRWPSPYHPTLLLRRVL